MTVSVIIPCYNALPYIKDTLESVNAQSYKNIEIIVIDDGSTDGSFQFLQSLQWNNFILKKNKGKGACAARNYGFELSTGDYIQYLDADDLLSARKIELQTKLISENDKDAILNCKWGRFYKNSKETIWENRSINKDYLNPLDWLIDSWNGKGVAQTSVWLTPRHLIKKAGGWNEKLLLNQDGEFFARILLQASAIRYCEGVGVHYRSGNPDSISNKNSRSLTKVKSLLHSFCLYKYSVLKVDDNLQIRRALGNNFLSFIYQFNTTYPKMTAKAEEEFYQLGFKKMWPVGGRNFRKLASVIGFKTSLKLLTLKNFITS